MAEPAPMRFDAGRVVGRSLGVFARRWPTIVAFALVVWAIAVVQSLGHFAEYKHGSHDARAFAGYWAFAIVFVAVGWLKDAAIVAAALAAADAPRPLAHAARGALRVFLPLLPFRALAAGPALLWNAWAGWALSGPAVRLVQLDLAVGTGLWLYGLVLTAFFGLVTPAALVEGKGLIASLRRSSELLSAARWRFVALSILMDVAGALPAILGGALVALMASAVRMQDSFVVEGVIVALMGSLVTALWLVITAVSYQELRRLREGAPHDQLAAIFA